MNTALARIILICTLVYLISTIPVPAADIASDSTSPNIILIMTDDQGWGDLSITGNTNLHTPNIDNLARNGATLQHFYVSPVCSPTRAEVLTGRYHPRCGVYGTSTGSERMDLDEVTFAQVLQDAGYHTGAFGKWHNGMQYPYHPNARGFDEFYGFCSGHWGDYYSPMLEHNGAIVKGNGYVIDDFTDHAIQFIDDHQQDPFFIYLPYNTPHRPMQVPDRWWNKFADKELDMRHRVPEKEDVLHTRAALAMCENIDWNVGRVLEKLDDLQLLEETIVIYLSDNGPNGDRWNGGMKGKKGSTDEGGVRSPTFIQWQGTIREGLVVEEIAGGIDFFPTLLDLTGIDYTTDRVIDGVSIAPLLLEEEVTWPSRNLFSYWNGNISVRNQEFRLDADGQLYNLKSDPGQYTNVADKWPEIMKSMMEASKEWEMHVLSELNMVDQRSFPLGHPDFRYTQLPARDGIAYGQIERSNRWPNCSYYTHWTSTSDSITWDVDVLSEGLYEVVLYYTCAKENVGTEFHITCTGSRLNGKITKAHDPPLVGMEHDRHPRGNSLVKDFKPLTVGEMHLFPGRQTLSLRATEIPGKEAMDFRLMMFNKVDSAP